MPTKNMEECDICLPNFLIAGASKCGTTSLYYYLKEHPEIFMSRIKEPAFFLWQITGTPGNGIGDKRRVMIRSLEDYLELFRGSEGKKAVGEASVHNLYHSNKTIGHIKNLLGDPKIIIVLRDPVERAFSAYMHLVRDNREFLPFEQALDQEAERIRKGWSSTWYYKDGGFYFRRVRDYLENFTSVKVSFFEDLKNDALLFTQDIYRFLEVDASFTPDAKARYNTAGRPRYRRLNSFFIKRPSVVQSFTRAAGKTVLGDEKWAKLRDSLRARILVKEKMRPETREYLRQLYAKDILQLQELLGRDLGCWLES